MHAVNECQSLLRSADLDRICIEFEVKYAQIIVENTCEILHINEDCLHFCCRREKINTVVVKYIFKNLISQNR